MSSSESHIAEMEGFALELAQTAGDIARAHFRKSFTIENKLSEGFDPVTSADRAIEALLRQAIHERYPDHGIVGEEEGEHDADSPYTWYIDPIDGTRSFMTGSPLWGSLVGLTHGAKPLFGLLCQPVLNEIFFGSPGGSWLITDTGRDRLRARQCTELDNAALTSTHPDLFEGRDAETFAALCRRCLFTRFGGDCYNYAMLAAGFTDLVVDGQLKSYDIVPLIPLLEGAGCTVSDWHGDPPLHGGLILAAATPELHAQALALLRM